jgi:hypothetical protein
LADIWYGLTIGDHLPKKLKLGDNEKNGLKRYMMTHHWFWAYPKNSSMLASRFKCSKWSCRGEPVWKWVKRIAAMRANKIHWEHVANEEHLEIFSILDDGTDFKLQEWKHLTCQETTLVVHISSIMQLLSMRLYYLYTMQRLFTLQVPSKEACMT